MSLRHPVSGSIHSYHMHLKLFSAPRKLLARLCMNHVKYIWYERMSNKYDANEGQMHTVRMNIEKMWYECMANA